MTKNNNTIYWIIGIIIFLIVITQVPFKFPFVIVTKTVCMDDTISYWDFDGNVLDAQGIYNGNIPSAPFAPTFVSGKLGQALEFNTTTYVNLPTVSAVTITMWVKNYSDVGSDWYFIANANGVNYTNGALDNTKQIITIGSNFGLGLNGSVDEIAIFDRELSASEISALYTSPKKICYTVSMEENVSCKDYATEMVTSQTTGCLNYSGDFWPDCEYEWETISGFYVSGSECLKRFYCKDILTTDFDTLVLCQAELTYDCYVISTYDYCSHRTDYDSCVVGTSYKNLTDCEVAIGNGGNGANGITPECYAYLTGTCQEVSCNWTQYELYDTLTECNEAHEISECIFEPFGICITMFKLIIILVIIGAIYYFREDLKKYV